MNQIILRPQDLVVVLKLAITREAVKPSFESLGRQTGLSTSATFASVNRARLARLLTGTGLAREDVDRHSVLEFILHGARFAFPATIGSMTLGVPTGYAAPPLNAEIGPSTDPPPVWPSPHGTVRGLALSPLYPTVPSAALSDPQLYQVLALFDALRSGSSRERSLATKALRDCLA